MASTSTTGGASGVKDNGGGSRNESGRGKQLIVPVGTLEECIGSVVKLLPTNDKAILFIVVPISGPISPPKLILGVTT
ncbi:hypothetical protein E2C01_038752 [Portunus trituberculatus]|uniref:Uncharacterized protein n=1 Tax=Portunus trituberculatus TaxID=210409 RepID=A0A5B7FJC8_PORTR|nr:hypothetical protein [Portunus trituberculatus]